MRGSYACLVLLLLLSSCGGGGGSGGTGNECGRGLLLDRACVDGGQPETTACLDPVVDSSIELTAIAESPNAAFRRPIAAVAHESGWFVGEQHGAIRHLRPPHLRPDPSAPPALVLDLRERVAGAGPDENWELGFLGMALHPSFPDDPRIFVHYTRPEGAPAEAEEPDWRTTPARSVISSFRWDGGREVFLPASEEILLSVVQPGLCHNGGSVVFDLDGYLLLSLGDGCRDSRSSQDTRSLLGSLLRLDINRADEERGTPYSIPPDNPFANDARYAAEIAVYGLRNPWRVTVDRETGAIWMGDVGEARREEVNRLEHGANYGWPLFEGYLRQHGGELAAAQDPVGFPAATICRDDVLHVAITGGYVYRGTAIPELTGTYIFANGMSGTIYGIPADTDDLARARILGTVPGAFLSSFAEDAAGELYAVDLNGGRLVSFVGGPPVPPPARRLSRTGLVAASDPASPHPDAIRYEVNLPFFSDHADKERWLLLPEGGRIEIDAETGNLVFPEQTDFVKSFRREGAMLETRLLRRIEGPHWRGWTWRWEDSADDADILEAGTITGAGEDRWFYPGRGDCLRCHTAVAGHALGLTVAQLSSRSTPGEADLLDFLFSADLLDTSEAELAELRERFPPFPAIDDEERTTDERARAFLHVNCSNCHQPGGPADGRMDLRHSVALADMQICNVEPSIAWSDINQARIVAPGEPERSTLYRRLRTTGEGRMHPYRLRLDEDGSALIRAWIEGLDCE